MDRTRAYVRLRGNIGRTILLGLEVLIVADIVLTVAIDSTIESAITLGVIVLVRTFLSFSLEIELDGVVPWRRRAVEASEAAGPGRGRPDAARLTEVASGGRASVRQVPSGR